MLKVELCSWVLRVYHWKYKLFSGIWQFVLSSYRLKHKCINHFKIEIMLGSLAWNSNIKKHCSFPLMPFQELGYLKFLTKFVILWVEKKNQLDATEWFMALIMCSTCFGHFYAHHQELETTFVLLLPMVCIAWLLVVGDQVQYSMLCVQEEGCCTSCSIPLPGRIACCPSSDPNNQ